MVWEGRVWYEIESYAAFREPYADTDLQTAPLLHRVGRVTSLRPRRNLRY